MKQEDKATQEELRQHEDAAVQPDPETLHKTDPQENMEGPISSLVQNIKENFEEDDDNDVKAEEEKD